MRIITLIQIVKIVSYLQSCLGIGEWNAAYMIKEFLVRPNPTGACVLTGELDLSLGRFNCSIRNDLKPALSPCFSPLHQLI